MFTANGIETISPFKLVGNSTMANFSVKHIIPKTVNDRYTDNQKKMLAKYGLTNGVYSSINNVKKEATEKYLVTEVKFTIKGMASIPSMNSVIVNHKLGLKKQC